MGVGSGRLLHMSQPTQLAPPNNSLALAGFVMGLVAWALALAIGARSVVLFILATGLFSLLAIIFGFVGIATANRLGGKRRGLAIWAVILGFTPLVAVFIRGFFV